MLLLLWLVAGAWGRPVKQDGAAAGGSALPVRCRLGEQVLICLLLLVPFPSYWGHW